MARSNTLSDGDETRQTLASSISVSLRQAIMRGELRPGAKLHVADLREQFDVSLSPLREALSRLSSEGLVNIEDQRGYRVAAVSDQNLAEVIRLRMELEALALRESLARSDENWRGFVSNAMAALAECVRIPDDDARNEAWETSHREFHLTLLSGCRMPMLLSFIKILHDLSDRYRRLFLKTNPPDRDVPDEHRRIYDAVMTGEAELACALLRQHIQRTGSNVRAALLRDLSQA